MNKQISVVLAAACVVAGGLVYSALGAGQGPAAAPVPAGSPPASSPASTPQIFCSDLTRDMDCWEAVSLLAARGVLLPGEDGRFHPDEPATRAQAVTALCRLAGGAPTPGAGELAGGAEDGWYAGAVDWARAQGILDGEEALFEPGQRVTRADLAALMFSSAAFWGASQDCSGDLSAFQDTAQLSREEAAALSWAVERGLFPFLGPDGALYPRLYVSRGQLAQALAALEDCGQVLVSHSAPSPEGHAALERTVAQAAQRHDAVGVQAAVIRNGAVTDACAWGWATRDSDPMTIHHKIRAASLSKVLVGLSAVTIHDQGIVDLDADISAYWGAKVGNPAYPDRPVTIDTLLTHTSSLTLTDSIAALRRDSALRRLQGAGYRDVAPGDLEGWAYSNYGFAVLGMTLELAAGRTLDEVLADRYFTPLGIDAAFEGGSLQNTGLLASLYMNGALSRPVSESKRYVRDPRPGCQGNFFAGGFTCSAYDLAKLTALLAGDGVYEGVRLLPAEEVAAMEAHGGTLLPDGFYQCRPLRCQSQLYGRDTLYYHTGSAFGVYNFLSYDPETGDGVVVLTTGADGVMDERGIYAVCGEIAQAVYAGGSGTSAPDGN